MKLGTRSSVVASPLIRPIPMPTSSIRQVTGTIRLSSSPISSPAITTCAVTTAPMERSNSPETITKYWPIAAIAIGAVRPRNRMITPGSPKLGLATMIAISSPIASTNTAPPGVATAAAAR